MTEGVAAILSGENKKWRTYDNISIRKYLTILNLYKLRKFCEIEYFSGLFISELRRRPAFVQCCTCGS